MNESKKEHVAMKKKERYIYEGEVEVFLVYDESFQNPASPFVDWLEAEGFSYAARKRKARRCDWIYVNISRKLYANGIPKIRLVHEIGNHAITIKEFRTIYSIYKKYEGKDVFVFHSEWFDYDKEQDTQFLIDKERIKTLADLSSCKLLFLRSINWLREYLSRFERRIMEGMRGNVQIPPGEAREPFDEDEVYAMQERCTWKEFKDATVKAMETYDLFQEKAKNAGVPLRQYCEEYFDDKEANAEKKCESVQEYYGRSVRDSRFFEDWAENLAHNWHALEKNYTLEEFKAAVVEEMAIYGFFKDAAKKGNMPLSQYCRAYVEYMDAEDEDEIVQQYYRNLFRSSSSFRYLANNLAYTWDMFGEDVPIEDIYRYAKICNP